MSEAKTKPTAQSVDEFLQRVDNAQQRADAYQIVALMREITGEEPVMWGPSIVGFGSYHYRYASGHEGDSPITGFSPRKGNTVVYLSDGFEEHSDLLSRLGKHKTGKVCLYLKRLGDVDQGVLRELVQRSVEHMRRMYPAQAAS